jgi:hypothetical protein
VILVAHGHICEQEERIMSTSLDGAVAIVTGAARGMGAEHVRGLVAAGANVMATDILDAEGSATGCSSCGSTSFEPLGESRTTSPPIGASCC